MLKNRNINVKETLITLLLYAVIFPFVFFPPLNTDLQPLAGILAFLVLLRFKKMMFTPLQVYLGFLLMLICVLSIVFFLYGLIKLDEFDLKIFQFSKVFSVFYGLLIFYVFESGDIHFRKRILNRSVLIYATCTLAYVLFKEKYLALQWLIVNDRGGGSYLFSLSSFRGISILTPEPSVFSSILIFLLRLNDHFFYDEKENSRKRYLLNFFLLVVMILMSKSATGLLLMLIYLFFLFIKHVKYSLVYIGSFGTAFILFLLNYDFSNSNNRALALLGQLFSNKKFSVFDVLLLDASFKTRFSDWLLGFYSFFTFPLGVGYVSFYEALVEIGIKYKIRAGTDVGTGLVSPLAYVLIVFGLPMVLLVLIIFSKPRTYWFDKLYFFYHISFSISFGFPLSWVILTLNKKNKKL